MMEPQRYTSDEQALFEQELEQNLRTEVPTMREEEIKAAARRASARELEQQREALRGELDDEVVAVTEEPSDLRAEANREAPSKVLLGIMLLLLLLFTLAVFDRLPWASARASDRQQAVPPNNGTLTTILGDAAASPALQPSTPPSSASPVPSFSPVPPFSPPAVQAAMLPQTGGNELLLTDQHLVDPLFGHFYWDHGGVRVFGRPTSPLLSNDGRQVQMFEHARFEYWPNDVDVPVHVEMRHAP
jgi:hypothetical protein